jgi:hypothetical protein
MPIKLEDHAYNRAQRLLVVNEEYPLAANHSFFGAAFALNPRHPGVTVVD